MYCLLLCLGMIKLSPSAPPRVGSRFPSWSSISSVKMPKNKRNRHRSKRQWRDIDTTEIEDDNFRKQEELLAGGPISKRKTSDLAFVDKGGNSSAPISPYFILIPFERSSTPGAGRLSIRLVLNFTLLIKTDLTLKFKNYFRHLVLEY